MDWLRPAALALVLAGSPGCIPAAAGAVGMGVYAYTRGDLEATLDAPLEDAWEATLGVADERGLVVRSRSKDELGATLVAGQATGERVWITLQPRGADRTSVNVRVGLLGDEPRSREILHAIERSL